MNNSQPLFMSFFTRILEIIKQDWFIVLKYFTLSRILIYILGVISLTNFYSKSNSKTKVEDFNAGLAWHQFDAKWYEKVVIEGYTTNTTGKSKASTIAFMPLYPMSIKYTMDFTGFNFDTSAFILSNTYSYFALLFIYKYVKKKIKDPNKFLLFFLLSAGSFYLSVAYTESLFLLFTALTFYFSDKKKYMYAGLFIGLAIVTRIQAAALLAIPIIDLFFDKGVDNKKKLLQMAIIGIVSSLPILAYMYFINSIAGNPLAFVSAQAAWDNPNPYPLKAAYGLLVRAYGSAAIVHASLWGLYFFILARNLHRFKWSFIVFFVGVFIISSSIEVFYGTYRYVLPLFLIQAVVTEEKEWVQHLFMYTNFICPVYYCIYAKHEICSVKFPHLQ